MGGILALLVLLAALFSIFWQSPNIEHFELVLIALLALAFLLGSGNPIAELRSWTHREPKQ